VCTVGEKSAIAKAVGDVRTVVEGSNKKKEEHHAIRQSFVIRVVVETPPT
jgi:hypothetical protein